MKQYYSIKSTHPEAILLFRVGDFYETFGEDAIRASAILGITLTKRANGAASFVELAGFPHHAVDTYLPKLVRAGERVAICEQLEDPKSTKGIVKRGVIELVTPGVVIADNALSAKENRFLASIHFGKSSIGLSLLDISTGEFYCAEGNDKYIDKLLSNFAPKEVLYQRGCEEQFMSAFGTKLYTYKLDGWLFADEVCRQKLCAQFNTPSLKGFGVETMTNAICAAGAALSYLEFTEHKQTAHINSISRIDQSEHVWIDRFTISNLELFERGTIESHNGERVGFASVIDRTLTPMGARLLRRWIAMPIKSIERLNNRLDIVSSMLLDRNQAMSIEESISQIGDIERMASRVAAQRIAPREFVQLKCAIGEIGGLKRLLTASCDSCLRGVGELIEPLEGLYKRLDESLFPDPNNNIAKGGVIACGVNMELDDLRRVASHGKELLQNILDRESARTGIPSLKISFNNVFGYYIEVRNAHKERVPEEWIRKQTLTAAERYITPELKEYEQKILGAEARIAEIEQQIYTTLIAYTAESLRELKCNAQIVARLDVLQSFATLACERRYTRPQLNDSDRIDIKQGRHPVIEALMPIGERYIPNDILLNGDDQQIMMITGPNMSGKSALLRQTALIVLMAQIGSFVPASSAEIGVVDKIFTRVGASDNISQGESTFMVEMLESASILNNITDRSLVILDEIGRGTSTYDGISIAWAMVEYLHNHPRSRAKTLFATHYHELNELECQCERVKNYHVSVKEMESNIIFVRKLERGSTEHSFGIHVARMAGMPSDVVSRANQILQSLESNRGDGLTPQVAASPSGGIQLSMFQLDDPILVEIRDQIKDLDLNNLTPLEALNKLAQIKKLSGL
ncbi:MAG: DNA mismatch repair protein MutS [Rikenellaceae bacterium]